MENIVELSPHRGNAKNAVNIELLLTFNEFETRFSPTERSSDPSSRYRLKLGLSTYRGALNRKLIVFVPWIRLLIDQNC